MALSRKLGGLAQNEADETMTRKSLSKLAELNIRAMIDEIALQVADPHGNEDDLSTKISDATMEHITRLQEDQTLSEEELDRIASAIVRGVLKRLNQIVESGGQFGNA